MMESILFVEEKLRNLFSKHEYLEIRYEYKALLNTHIVEIKPVHCFEKDRVFAVKQMEIEMEFREAFPFEEILFITENILIQIQKPILELGVCSGIDISSIILKRHSVVQRGFKPVCRPPSESIKTNLTNQDSFSESFFH